VPAARFFILELSPSNRTSAALAERIKKEIAMFETIKKILVDELQIEESAITLDAELSADLGINSIELANLVMLCEDQFDLVIEDEDIHRFITVGDVVTFLENR
jgi:acyl carrier protein